MTLMPRPRPPHLHLQQTRHGRPAWYVRKGHGRRVRIRAAFGTAEFDTEYQAALNSSARPLVPKGPADGTLAWLIARYRETTFWTNDLSNATQRQRENIFKNITGADQPFAAITKDGLIAARDKRAGTPAQARNFLDAMRGLFRWAVAAKHCKTDPTIGVKNPPRKKGRGFQMWSEEEMTKYETKWPIGTRQRVWLDVLAYTGLRRGDAIRLGKQHIRNGVATLKTEKGGFTVTVTLPILPALASTLEAGPCGDLTFIVGANGKPLTKESFGNMFKAACKDAGVPGSAHGVRKIAATRAAENGATVAELEAIFGWHGGGMASHYTKEANRVRLAKESMHKLVNNERTSIPSPFTQAPSPQKDVK